jgi:hypothetical protein
MKHIILSLLMAAAFSANASNITIDTLPATSNVGPFSDTSIATWGQTFRSPGAGTLDRFRLSLDIVEPGEFKFYLSEWAGDRATGVLLYESILLSPSAGDFLLDVQPNVALKANTDYVAFVNNSAFRNTGLPLNAGIDTGASYLGGNLYFNDNGTSFPALSVSSWIDVGLDAAFRADITVSTVPESGSTTLYGAMALGVLAWLRFRRNQQQV